MGDLMARDHGGNLDAAKARWGGGRDDDWIDLSTGINRLPWPVPQLPASVWTNLPDTAAKAALIAAAQTAWGGGAPMVATAGAQAAIQMIPRLRPPGQAKVLGPTYNEHAATLRATGWQVREVPRLADLAGADLAVVVNPNNPDGQRHAPQALHALRPFVGRLVVDESFADPVPELSLLGAANVTSAGRAALAATWSGRPGSDSAGSDDTTSNWAGLLILRSFGKFYGLAGMRLGFVAGDADDIARLREMAGPWPVSGAALAIGTAALADRAWARATTARLADDAARADALAQQAAGWRMAGGTALFRLYDTPDALAAQDRLARSHIWSRIFPWHPRWLRLGLPGSEAEWTRLARALA